MLYVYLSPNPPKLGIAQLLPLSKDCAPSHKIFHLHFNVSTVYKINPIVIFTKTAWSCQSPNKHPCHLKKPSES